MKDFVCASTAGFVSDTPIVDISYLEESQGGPELVVALLPKSDQIVEFQVNSRLHLDNFENVLDMAVKGCKDIHAVLSRAVKENVSELASHMNKT